MTEQDKQLEQILLKFDRQEIGVIEAFIEIKKLFPDDSHKYTNILVNPKTVKAVKNKYIKIKNFKISGKIKAKGGHGGSKK